MDAVERYREMVVGGETNLHLLVYEFINMLFLPIRGRIGKLLRSLTLPLIFNHIGIQSTCGSNCTVRNGKKIMIGDRVAIDDDVTLDVKPGDNKLNIENEVHIGKRTIFNCSGGIIEIGEGTVIGSYCRLGSLKGLSIGKYCRIEENCCFSSDRVYERRL